MKRTDFLLPKKPKVKRVIKKKKVPKDRTTKTVGNAWVGRWRDGTLGWGVPNWIGGSDIPKLDQRDNPWFWCDEKNGERLYKCKVTIEQVFDKNGVPITRKNPKIKEK